MAETEIPPEVGSSRRRITWWRTAPPLLSALLVIWLCRWNLHQGQVQGLWIQEQEGRDIWHAILQEQGIRPETMAHEPHRLNRIGTGVPQLLMAALRTPQGWITAGPRVDPDVLTESSLPEPGTARRRHDGTVLFRFRLQPRPEPNPPPEFEDRPHRPFPQPMGPPSSRLQSFLDPPQNPWQRPDPPDPFEGLFGRPAPQPPRRPFPMAVGGGPDVVLWYELSAAALPWPWFFQAALWPTLWVIGTIVWGSFIRSQERVAQMQQEHQRQTHLAAVGRMTARLAHEIRNPLGAIRGAAQHLQTKLAGQSGSQLLDLIDQETARLEALTRGILDFSRPRNLQPTPGDLIPVLRDLIHIFSLSQPGRQIQTVFPEQPCPARFDREAVHQILLNLFKNAHDAAPPNTPIRVRLVQGPVDVAIQVDDQGPGIAPENLENLFQPFFSTKTLGYGLGLVVSRQMAEGQRGRLTLQNLSLGGCRAELRLPRGGNP